MWQNVKDFIQAALTSGPWWGAIIVLMDRLQSHYLTQVPEDIWTALINVLMATLGVAGIIVTANKIKEVRVVRAARAAATAQAIQDTWSAQR